jgi:hypothetical protein
MPILEGPVKAAPRDIAKLKQMSQVVPAVFAKNNSTDYATVYIENEALNGEAASIYGDVSVNGNVNVERGSLILNGRDVINVVDALQFQVQNMNTGLQHQIKSLKSTIAQLQFDIQRLQQEIGI